MITTFVANFHSKSGDRYTIVFEANRKPESDEDWLKIIKKELPGEYSLIEYDEGHGIENTFLYVEECLSLDYDMNRYEL